MVPDVSRILPELFNTPQLQSNTKITNDELIKDTITAAGGKMFCTLLLALTLHIVTAHVSDDAVIVRKPYGAEMCKELGTGFASSASTRFVKEELTCYLSSEPKACKVRNIARRILSRSKGYLMVQKINLPPCAASICYIILNAGEKNINVTFHEENMSWDEAERVCRSEGASLVKVDTIQKQSALWDNLSHLKDCLKAQSVFWMGLSDVKKDNVFKWIDGNQLTYNNWGKGQPDNKHTKEIEDCVALNIFDSVKWHDYSCSKKNGFICEWALGSLKGEDSDHKHITVKHD